MRERERKKREKVKMTSKDQTQHWTQIHNSFWDSFSQQVNLISLFLFLTDIHTLHMKWLFCPIISASISFFFDSTLLFLLVQDTNFLSLHRNGHRWSPLRRSKSTWVETQFCPRRCSGRRRRKVQAHVTGEAPDLTLAVRHDSAGAQSDFVSRVAGAALQHEG